jgi:ERCC4-related helicase
MNQQEQQQLLDDFRAGVVNVLLATSIGEEGLDIPEARPSTCGWGHWGA